MPTADPDEASGEEIVLGFLAEAGDDFISGETLTNKLGLSSAAVWRHVESLRQRGYRIEASLSKGYRLVEIPDRLTGLEVGPLLSTHDFGRTIHHFESCSSTSDVASQLAEEGALHGEVVIAESQTAGRGRRGRSWVSPPGKNLYVSVVLRPELPPPRAPELTMVAAVAVAETLGDANVPAEVKWPNDLEVDGKKVAGILTELHADPHEVHSVIVGIGVNLNIGPEDLPADLRSSATSARMVRGSPIPRALFAAALLTRFEQWFDRHAEEGFEVVLSRWRDLTSTLGERVLVRTGGREVRGIAQDVDETGALLVAQGNQVERVVAGDVELLRREE